MAMIKTCKAPVLQTKSASGAIASFDTILTKPLEECTSLITGYQEGSGTPSPSNVRNLVSFLSANLYVSAKNIIDINDAHITSQTFSSIFSLKAGTYTLSANYNNISNIIGYLRLNTRYEPVTQLTSLTLNANDSGRISASFTLENDSVCRLAFQGASTGYDYYVSNIMLEVDGSETSFEPYNGNTYTFTFGQSIYQGYIDWLRGVVVGTHKKLVLTSSINYGKSTSYPGAYYLWWILLDEPGKPNSPFICDRAKTVMSISDYVYGTCYSDSTGGIRIMPENTTLQDWKDYIDAQVSAGTPVTIAYELATPIEIPLGGINLLTQEGQNNIFADTGDVDLTYKDLDIAKRGNFREVFKLPS